MHSYLYLLEYKVCHQTFYDILMKPTVPEYNQLVTSIENLVSNAKQQISKTVNQTMIITNWKLGQYIVEFEQNGKHRAEYGAQLVKRLSIDLTKSFGGGFSYRNLQLFKKFYSLFPIMQTVSAQLEMDKMNSFTHSQKVHTPSALFEDKLLKSINNLSWSHFVRVLSLKNEGERNFYVIETSENQWSLRELNRQINSSLYERLALSKDKKGILDLAKHGHELNTHEDLLKDPLVLEFLNIKENNRYSENDIETAIIDNLGDFLLELGKGFSFVARQKRITSGSEHFYIDLVFYNRLLRSFVLIDIKIGKIKHQDIGQMQMYVNYFDRKVKTNEENPTIGIILCKENDEFVVEFTLPEENKQIFSKEYKLYLPNKEELQKMLATYL